MSGGEGRRGEGLRLGSALWFVAYLALLLGGLASRGETAGVVGVAAGGGLVWGLALVVDVRSDGGSGPRRRGKPLVPILLAIAGLAEGIAASRAWVDGDGAQGVRFALAAGYALAGLVTSARREPSDGAFACALFFHFLMLFPALAQLAAFFLDRPGGVAGSGPLRKVLSVIVGVAFPCLFAALLFSLLHDLSRPPSERDRPSSALLAAEAAFVLALSSILEVL